MQNDMLQITREAHFEVTEQTKIKPHIAEFDYTKSIVPRHHTYFFFKGIQGGIQIFFISQNLKNVQNVRSVKY